MIVTAVRISWTEVVVLISDIAMIGKRGRLKVAKVINKVVGGGYARQWGELKCLKYLYGPSVGHARTRTQPRRRFALATSTGQQ